tara:strand:+ start:1495 stop:1962 length:468 start_codon:yes stop_codon:yes gene_type:complete
VNLRGYLPDPLARLTGTRRHARRNLQRVLNQDRKRTRVKRSERVGPPFPRFAEGEGEALEVVDHGPRVEAQALRVQYRLTEDQYRLGFVAKAADGAVWCLVSLLPGDDLTPYPEAEEVFNSRGQRCVRRGWGLAVCGAAQGTAPGTFQPLRYTSR